MARTFYRYLISVEVLSEEELEFESLHQVANAIVSGDCSGTWKIEEASQVDAPTMAKMLLAQSSDPEFFQLDDDGRDLLEEEEEPE